MTSTTKKSTVLELKDQFCTIEQSKTLKELGIKSGSAFIYIEYGDNGWWMRIGHFCGFGVCSKNDSGVCPHPDAFTGEYPAYSVAELGQMLPDFEMSNSAINEWQYRPFKQFYSHDKKRQWKFDNHFTESGGHRIVTNCKTEAEARANMLIWMIKKGHVTSLEVNERLGIKPSKKNNNE